MIVKNNVDSMIAAADVIRKCRDTLDRLNCMDSLSEEEGGRNSVYIFSMRGKRAFTSSANLRRDASTSR